jgi:hypothetical protein
MNYKEAQELSLQVQWKTITCPSGEKCWCRIIEPKDLIVDDSGNEIYTTGAGVVPKIYAEYIVNLHNENIKNNKP